MPGGYHLEQSAQSIFMTSTLLNGLPTDNLYKFMALMGLATAIFFAVYPQELADREATASADLAAKAKKISVQQKALSDKIGSKEEAIAARNFPSDAEMKELREALQALEIATIELDAETTKRGIADKAVRRYDRYAAVGFLFGSFLCVSGFVLWWLRVQRFQDAKVAIEAASAKK